MRYDTPVYFQRLAKGEYNASTGNYGESTTVETKRWASVTDAGDEMLIRIFGKVRQGCKVVRLQSKYTEPFDRIRIGEQVYSVSKVRTLRTKQVYVVTEVQ